MAPSWKERALSEEEQRWVSGCMLARINYFGVPVQLSLRTRDEVDYYEALKSTQEERERFNLYEAGFYGNLFDEKP